MLKFIRFLFSIGVAALTLVSCGPYVETRISPYPDEPAQATSIAYESDDEGPPVEEQPEDATARLAATEKGKVCIGYMNNETELFRPSSYTVTFWRRESLSPNASMADMAQTVASQQPYTSVVKKANGRSYTRKTIRTGFYIVNASDSNLWYQFEVVPNSDGLLIFNENNQRPDYAGYFSNYGKVKVSLWYGKVKPEEAHVRFTGPQLLPDKPGINIDTWIYAEDGKTTKRGMFWFMPANPYSVTHWANKPGGAGTYPSVSAGSITIAPGKTYPHIKLAYN